MKQRLGSLTWVRSFVTLAVVCLTYYCPGTAKRRIKEAVIKSAAGTASLGFAGERLVPRRPHAWPSSWRSPANPREAALAADLITASLIRLVAVPGQQTRKKGRKVTELGKYASKSHIFDGKFNFKAWRRLWDWSRTLKTSNNTI